MKYVFDANIFINLQRRQPIDLYKPLWEIISNLMRNGTIISSAEVLDEINRGNDELKAWVKQREDCFIESDTEIQLYVREILKQDHGLVDGGKKNNCADPFVIALAKLREAKVVTEESPSSNEIAPKIPDVCRKHGVEYLNFVDFMREANIAL
jgi:predicted nucleic acid-binding protein